MDRNHRKIYRALKYSDERKVTFGEFQQEGPTKEWWRVIEERWVIEETPCLWSSFFKEFCKKNYTSGCERNERGGIHRIEIKKLNRRSV